MKKFIKLLLLLLAPFSVKAQSDSLPEKEPFISLRGYIKNMQIASFGDNLNNINSDNLLHNRLNFSFNATKPFSVGLELRNRLFWGESVDASPDYGKLVDVDNGLVDMSWAIVNEPSLTFLTQVDRAWLSWVNDKWDVRLGRQRINWGVNLFWNSNDLFNVYSLVDFDYEERPGSDALRIQRFFKNSRSIEVAVSPGKYSDDWVAATMYKFNRKGYDVQLLAGWWNTDIAIGGGWAGNLKNAGFKGELTYFHPKDNIADTLGTLSASLSYENILPGELFLTTGLLFNSKGIDSSFTLPQNLFALPISAKQLMPAKYSLLLSLNKSFSPVFGASLVAIYSPVIDATFLMPSITYSLANNWDLSMFGQSFFLDIGKYKNLGNGVFIRVKGSF